MPDSANVPYRDTRVLLVYATDLQLVSTCRDDGKCQEDTYTGPAFCFQHSQNDTNTAIGDTSPTIHIPRSWTMGSSLYSVRVPLARLDNTKFDFNAKPFVVSNLTPPSAS
jgi:hypothetical protein